PCAGSCSITFSSSARTISDASSPSSCASTTRRVRTKPSRSSSRCRVLPSARAASWASLCWAVGRGSSAWGIVRTPDRAFEGLHVGGDGITRGEEVLASPRRQLLAGADRLQMVPVLTHVPDCLLEPLARTLQVRGGARGAARLLAVLCL